MVSLSCSLFPGEQIWASGGLGLECSCLLGGVGLSLEFRDAGSRTGRLSHAMASRGPASIACRFEQKRHVGNVKLRGRISALGAGSRSGKSYKSDYLKNVNCRLLLKLRDRAAIDSSILRSKSPSTRPVPRELSKMTQTHPPAIWCLVTYGYKFFPSGNWAFQLDICP
jgi:hypothetical protein